MSRSSLGTAVAVAAAASLVAACRAPGDTVLHVGHRDRTYAVFVPTDTPGMPLVIALHGAGSTGPQTEKLTHLDQLAAAEQFVVAYPDGIDHRWSDGRPGWDRNVDDVGFIAALIDELATRYAIDRKRVYVTGISNGGLMAYRLACELADRIAAIAPVAGALARDEVARCHPAVPVSVLAINGTADPLIKYDGAEGRPGMGAWLSAPESTRVLAEADHCGPAAAPVDEPDRDPDDGTRSHLIRYADCPAPLAVELVSIEGGGHTWPGASQYLPKFVIGPVSRDFDATDRMWQFFVAHGRR